MNYYYHTMKSMIRTPKTFELFHQYCILGVKITSRYICIAGACKINKISIRTRKTSLLQNARFGTDI